MKYTGFIIVLSLWMLGCSGSLTVNSKSGSAGADIAEEARIQPGPPAKLAFKNKDLLGKKVNECVELLVELRDDKDIPVANVGKKIFVDLEDGGDENGEFYSDATCSSLLANEQTEISEGEKITKAFYYKKTTPGAPVITASDEDGEREPAELTAVITDPDEPKLVFTLNPTSATADDCSPVIVQLQKKNGSPNKVKDQNLTVTLKDLNDSKANFYSASNCGAGSLISSAPILVGQSSTATFYGKKSNTGTYNIVAEAALYNPASASWLVTAGAPSKFKFSGTNLSQTTASCGQLKLSLYDANDNLATLASPTSLNLADNSTGAFYSDSNCTGGNELTSVALPSGNSSTANFWYKNNSLGTHTLTADHGILFDAVLPISINLGPVYKLVFTTGPTSQDTSACGVLVISAQDIASNNVTVASTIYANLTSSNGGLFYSDATCTTVATSTQITTGSSSSPNFYYKRTTPASSITLSAIDTAGPAYVNATTSIDINLGPISQLAFSTSFSSLVADSCGSLAISSQDAAGNIVTGSTITATLADASDANGDFYSDAGCTSTLASIDVSSGSGTTPTFYYQHSTPGSITLTGVNGSYDDAVITPSITAGAVSKIVFSTAPATASTDDCSALRLEARSVSDVATSHGSDITVDLGTNGIGGDFYSNSDCSTALPGDQIVLEDGNSQTAIFYYAQTGTGNITLTSQDSLTSYTGDSTAITVSAGSPSSFTVAFSSVSPVSSDDEFSVTITAKDANGNTATSYAGSKALSFTLNNASSSPNSTAPKKLADASYTFTSGVYTSAATAFAFYNDADTNITLDVTDGSLSGSSTAYAVNPGAKASYVVDAPSGYSVTAGAGFNVRVTAYDAYGNVATGASDETLTFAWQNTTDSDTGAVSAAVLAPASSSFSSGVYTTSGNAFILYQERDATPALRVTGGTSSYTDDTPNFTVGHGTINFVKVHGVGTADLQPTNELGTDSISADDTLTVYSHSYDTWGNYIGLESVSWSGSGVVSGNLSSASGTSTTFTAVSTGTGAITADHATVTDDATGTITVTPGAATSFNVAFSSTSPVTAGADMSVTITAVDADGNSDTSYAGSKALAFTLNNATNAPDTTSPKILPDASYTFTSGVYTSAATAFAFYNDADTNITLDVSDGTLSGSSTAYAVNPGAKANYAVDAPSGYSVTAGAGFNVRVTAYDAYGNVATGASDETLTFAWQNTTDSDTGAVSAAVLAPASSSFSSGVYTTSGNAFILYQERDATPALRVTGGTSSYTDDTPNFTVGHGTINFVKVHGVGTADLSPSSELDTDSVASGATLAVYSHSYDTWGNYIGLESVSWSGSGVVSGNLSSASGTSTAFTAASTGTGDITADHSSVTDDTTGTITVGPAAPSYFTVSFSLDSPVTADDEFSVTITAKDTNGNTSTSYAGSKALTFTLNNASNSPNSTAPKKLADGSYTFTSGVYTSSVSDFAFYNDADTNITLDVTDGTLSGSSSAYAVDPGFADSYAVTSPSGYSVTAGAGFNVRVTAYDAYGNVATGASDETLTFAWQNTTDSDTGAVSAAVLAPASSSFSSGVYTTSGNAFILYQERDATPALRVTGGTSSYTDDTPNFTVGHGTINFVKVHGVGTADLQPSNEFGADSISADDTLTVYSHSYDSWGNYIGLESVSWSGSGVVSGNLSSASGMSTTFSAASTGTGTITADHAMVTDDLTGTITVTPGAATSFNVAFSAASPVTSDDEFSVTITAVDADGNTATNYTGSKALSFTLNNATNAPDSTPPKKLADANYVFASGTYTSAASDFAFYNDADTNITLDISDGSLSGSSAAYAVDVGVATQLTFSTAFTSADADDCGSLAIAIQDAVGNTVTGLTPTVNLTDAGDTNGDFYNDSGCSSSIGSIAINSGSGLTDTFYYKNSTPGSKTLTGASGTYSDAVTSFTINAGPVAKIVFSSVPTTATTDDCSTLRLQAQTTSDIPTTHGSDITIDLSTDGTGGDFYSDAGCSVPLASDQIVLNSGNSQTPLFYYGQTGTGSISVSALDSLAAYTGDSASITVSAGTAASFDVSFSSSSPVVAGLDMSVTITAKDSNGNTATSYSGSKALAFTLNNATNAPDTTQPKKMADASYTFTSGVYTSAATAFAFYNDADTNITLDVSDGTLSGSSSAYAVNPGAKASYVVDAPSGYSVTAGAGFNVRVTAYDAYGNVATGASDETLTFAWQNTTDSDTGAVSAAVLAPASSSFSSGVYTTSGNAFILYRERDATPALRVTGGTSSYTDDTPNFTVGHGTINFVKVHGVGTADLSPSSELDTDSVASGATLAVYSHGYDTWGNYIGLESVSWSGSGVVSGNLSSASGTSTTFTAASTGTGTITADHATVTDDSTGTITVTPGAATSFNIAFSSTSPVTAGADMSVTITAVDADGNTDTSYAGSKALTFTLNNASNAPDTTQPKKLADANYTFTSGVYTSAATAFAFYNDADTSITLDVSDGTVSGSSTAYAVNPGAKASYAVDAPSGYSVTAGAGFNVRVTAYDAYGNVATGASDETLTFAWQNTTDSDTGAVSAAVLAPASSSFSSGVYTTSGNAFILYQERDATPALRVTGGTSSYTDDTPNFTVGHGTINFVKVHGVGTADLQPTNELGTDSISADDTLTVYSHSYDTWGNYIGLESVSWSGSGVVSGNLSSASGTSTTFTAVSTGTGAITADHATVTDDATGTITVTPGAATSFNVAFSSTSPVTAGADMSVTITAVDADGNSDTSYAGSKALAFTLNNATNAPDTTSPKILPDASYTFTSGVYTSAATAFAFYNDADTNITLDVTDGTLSGSSTAYAVNPGAKASYAVDAPSGYSVTAGAGFNVRVTAYDAYGNVATGASDETLTFAWQNTTDSDTGAVSAAVLAPASSSFTNGVFTTTGNAFILYQERDATPALRVTGGTSSYTDDTPNFTVGHGTINFVKVHGVGTADLQPTNELGTDSISADDTLTVYSHSYDSWGNYIGLESVSWSGSSVVSGNLSSASGTSTTFAAASTGTGTITADHATVTDDSTGTITVTPGAATSFNVAFSGTSPVTAGADMSVTITAVDADGNTDTSYAGSKALTFTWTNATQAPDGTTNPKKLADTTYTFASGVYTSAANAFALYDASDSSITLDVSDGSLSGSSSSYEVNPDVITDLVFTSPVTNQTTDTCQAFSIQTIDFYNNPSVFGSSKTINLTTTSGGGVWYTAADCATDISSVTLASTDSLVTVYYRDSTVGTPTVGADESTSEGWNAAVHNHTVNVGAPSKLVFTTTPGSSSVAGSCETYVVTLQDEAGNAVTAPGTISIALDDASQDGSFHDSASCDSGTITSSIGIGSSTTGNIYYEVGSPNGTFNLTADDTSPDTYTTATAALTSVNNNPIMTTTAGTTGDEGVLYSYDANAADPDSHTLTWTLTTKPDWATVVPSTGVVSGTPGNSDIGANSFVLEASDGFGGTVTESWTVNVAATAVGFDHLHFSTSPLNVDAATCNSTTAVTIEVHDSSHVAQSITNADIRFQLNTGTLGTDWIIYDSADCATPLSNTGGWYTASMSGTSHTVYVQPVTAGTFEFSANFDPAGDNLSTTQGLTARGTVPQSSVSYNTATPSNFTLTRSNSLGSVATVPNAPTNATQSANTVAVSCPANAVCSDDSTYLQYSVNNNNMRFSHMVRFPVPSSPPSSDISDMEVMIDGTALSYVGSFYWNGSAWATLTNATLTTIAAAAAGNGFVYLATLGYEATGGAGVASSIDYASITFNYNDAIDPTVDYLAFDTQTYSITSNSCTPITASVYNSTNSTVFVTGDIDLTFTEGSATGSFYTASDCLSGSLDGTATVTISDNTSTGTIYYKESGTSGTFNFTVVSDVDFGWANTSAQTYSGNPGSADVAVATILNAVDYSFTSDSHVFNEGEGSIIRLPDGKIMTAVAFQNGGTGFTNYDIGISRFNSDLTPDTSFDSDGELVFSRNGSLPEQMPALAYYNNGTANDGKFILAAVAVIETADCNGELMIARFNANGSLDTSFGTNGVYQGGLTTSAAGSQGPVYYNIWSNGCPGDARGVSYTYPLSIDIQGDDKVVAAMLGYDSASWQPYFARLTANGTPDASFGNTAYDGWTLIKPVATGGNYIRDFHLLSDNSLLAAGLSEKSGAWDSHWYKLDSNGLLDASVEPAGDHFVWLPDFGGGYDFAQSITIDGNGKVILAGQVEDGGGLYNFFTARWFADGSVDSAYGSSGVKAVHPSTIGGVSHGAFRSIKIDSNNNVIAFGDYNKSASESNLAFAKFNAADGSLDSSFDNDDGIKTFDFGYDDRSRGFIIENDDSFVLYVQKGKSDGNYTPMLLRYTTVVPNDPPVVSDISDTSTTEDTSKQISFSVTGDSEGEITACNSTFFSMSSSDTAIVLNTSVVWGGTFPNCTADITPEPDSTGTTTITITADDGSGGTSFDSFDLNVTNANDAPVAADDSKTVAHNITASVDVLTNDSDADLDTLSIQSVGTPTNGTAVINGSNIDYTAPASGTSDSFTYTVADGLGGTDSGTVTITLAAPNPPVLTNAAAQSYSQNVAIAALDFSNSGADVTNCEVTPSLPTNLNLVINTIATPDTCQINGTPTATSATATYTVTAYAVDGTADTATVSITVKLSKPTNVSAISGNTEATVSWDSVSGASGYDLYWGTTTGIIKSSNKIAGVTSPYTHESLVNDQDYYYVVVALDSGAASVESDVSDEVTATPLASSLTLSGPDSTPENYTFPDSNTAANGGTGTYRVWTLTNFSGTTVAGIGITGSAIDFTIESTSTCATSNESLAAGASCTYVIKHMPSVAGASSVQGSFSITSDVNGFSLVLDGGGLALPAGNTQNLLTMYSPSAGFKFLGADTDMAENATMIGMVKNTGSVTETNVDVTTDCTNITVDDSDVVTGCTGGMGGQLAPGQWCSFIVTYTAGTTQAACTITAEGTLHDGVTYPATADAEATTVDYTNMVGPKLAHSFGTRTKGAGLTSYTFFLDHTGGQGRNMSSLTDVSGSSEMTKNASTTCTASSALDCNYIVDYTPVYSGYQFAVADLGIHSEGIAKVVTTGITLGEIITLTDSETGSTPSAPYFFGYARAGSKVAKAFVISNKGTGSVTLGNPAADISAVGPFSAVSDCNNMTLQPGDTCLVNVEYGNSVEGTDSGYNLEVKDASTTITTLALTGKTYSATGNSSYLVVKDNAGNYICDTLTGGCPTYNIGGAPESGSIQKMVTIENVGLSSATGFSYVPSGNDFTSGAFCEDSFAGCTDTGNSTCQGKASLAVGESCTVEIDLTPLGGDPNGTTYGGSGAEGKVDFTAANFNSAAAKPLVIEGKKKQTGLLTASDQFDLTVGQNDVIRSMTFDTVNKRFIVSGDRYNGTDKDIFVKAYNQDGTPNSTFGTVIQNHGGTDAATAVTTDPLSGNIYVCGNALNYVNATSYNDFVIWKVSPNGDTVSVVYSYDSGSGLYDNCNGLVFKGGYLFAVGNKETSTSSYDLLLVKIDPSDDSVVAGFPKQYDSGDIDLANNMWNGLVASADTDYIYFPVLWNGSSNYSIRKYDLSGNFVATTSETLGTGTPKLVIGKWNSTEYIWWSDNTGTIKRFGTDLVMASTTGEGCHNLTKTTGSDIGAGHDLDYLFPYIDNSNGIDTLYVAGYVARTENWGAIRQFTMTSNSCVDNNGTSEDFAKDGIDNGTTDERHEIQTLTEERWYHMAIDDQNDIMVGGCTGSPLCHSSTDAQGIVHKYNGK